MIVFYTSGHGFGHASRDIEVINAIFKHRSDLRLTIRTTVPPWFFNAALRRPVEIENCETDTGIVQVDSLRLDEEATALQAARFYQDFEQRVAAEADWLAAAGATVVVADAPPLACAAAARAGVPSIVLANFTWDWIYEGMPAFPGLAPDVLDVIGRAYASTSFALRLPLHGGFAPMADQVLDIPFVARRSSHTRRSAREALGIQARCPVVLASFGGHGIRMPYDAAAADGRLMVLLTDFEAIGSEASDGTYLRCLSREAMSARHLRYEDLVAASDVVISKPGYGIVSECIANGAALLYTSRGRMIEYEVFVEEMPRMVRCRYISQEDMLACRWADGVDALLAQPDAPTQPMTNGAEIAAEFILKTAA